jgi:hypothetical protein
MTANSRGIEAPRHQGPRRGEAQPLIERIDAFIAGFEQSGEAPDRWQYLCILDALDCLSQGNAAVAARGMALAETPHELRPPAEVAKIPKAITGLTAAELRIRFDEAVSALAQRA